jgi:phosphoserine aminotransferase
MIVSNSHQAREHDPILTRAKQVEVDYTDITSLTQAMEENNIHTVISAISLYSEEDSTSQLNLIKAAEKAGLTERFIPSEYSFIQTEEYATCPEKRYPELICFLVYFHTIRA